MKTNKDEFFFGNYYHIYNRGVEKRDIFCDHRDYKRFILSLKEFNNPLSIGGLREILNSKTISLSPTSAEVGLREEFEEEKLVEIVVYCLNPNHYHLILKELREGGISKFIQKVATGYTKYFNEKYKRNGALFQGRYKRIEIKSNPQLLYLSAYINANYYVHKIKKFEEWEFSSLADYVGERKGNLCCKANILEQFNGSCEDYKNFCKRICDDTKERRDFNQFLLE